MSKFDAIKEKFLLLGVREDNIDFAIGAVRDGTRRDHIIEMLTADYRGMTESQSTQLLEELFETNGGEFKKENQGGYLYGALLLLAGLIGAGFLISIIMTGEGMRQKFIVASLIVTVFGLSMGTILLVRAMRGRYRDDDNPLT